MEFSYAVPGLEGPGISLWDASALVQLAAVDFHALRNLLEDFGQRSAAAQGLKAPITDIWRLRSSDQRLYLQTAAAPAGGCVVLGGLKVGPKKLFLHRANGAIVEAAPLCVLDFYVHEAHQRQGVGKMLFEYMLEVEQLAPEQLGYDRPSNKLLAFLRRHYNLASYVPQPNNFVVYEQFFANMPGSPGRGGGGTGRSTGGGSTSSSSACWGPGALSSLGHGRQTLHIIGSRAAEVTGVDPGAAEQWLRTSLRPPTPSLQHCVQMHTAQGGVSAGGSNGSLGGSISMAGSSCCSSTHTSLGGAGGGPASQPPWSSLGGPGCPSAGTPTKRGQWDQPPSPTAAAGIQQQQWDQQQWQHQQSQQQQQQQQHYRRGAGVKELVHGSHPAEPYSHSGFQQALLASAANPAPPRIKAGPLPPPGSSSSQLITAAWQQQRQQQQSSGGGSCCSAQDMCTDSLDRFVGAAGAGGALQYSQQFGSGRGYAAGSTSSGGRPYAPSPPYGAWEPQPGSLLPQDGRDSPSDRVSLRQQAAQLAQQHHHAQNKPAWLAAGAGPPGHLLAAPVASYAVPTADMADVLGGVGGGAGGSRRTGGGNERSSNPLCLSWDGLPQQQGGGSVGGAYYNRAAAVTNRSGAGAASCMRMV